MSSLQRWMLYGATGYTGERIAEQAMRKGYRPLLAGRDPAKLKPLAERLGLPWQAVDLDDRAALERVVSQCSAVMHAAGPFALTAQPMLEACLATGTHYLDITGEVPVFESIAAHDARARDKGVMLMPGCGFDMVPGDCLALSLKRRMPDAVSLDIGMSFSGTLTRGTIRSAMASASPQAQVRRQHRLTTLEQPQVREFDFGPGPNGGIAMAHASTFGDISVAWRSTGIPDVTSFLRPAKEFAALATIRNMADIDALPAGPDADELAANPSIFVAEVRNETGATLQARLVTPQVYAITFDLASEIAQRVHLGAVRTGFQTPAILFGEDFILQFQGCRYADI